MFGKDIDSKIKGAKSEDERAAIFQELYPQAEVFWAFVVLLSRSLFEGDHEISVSDAQLLGLVDEVIGGGPFMSFREYQVKSSVKPKKKSRPLPTPAVSQSVKE